MRYGFIGLVLIILVGAIGIRHVAAQSGDPRPITADDATNIRLLTYLAGHTAPIAEMSFNPTSTAFLTGGLDGNLCVWNIDRIGQVAGQLRFCLAGYEAGFTKFVWTPDGNQLAVRWGDDPTINFYTTTTTHRRAAWAAIEPTATLDIDEPLLLNMRFVGDNNHLLLEDIFGTITLLDIETGEAYFSEVAYTYTVAANEQWIAWHSDASVVRVWDVAAAEPYTTLDINIDNMTFSPDGMWLLTWGSITQVWDMASLATRSIKKMNLTADVEAGLFSPDSSIVATWNDELITFWERETGNLIEDLRNHRGGVKFLVFNGDGSMAISVSERGTGRLWRITESGLPILQRWVEGEVDGYMVTPDGVGIVLTRESFAARFYSFTTGQLRGNVDVLTTQTLFSPDWTLAAVAEGNLIVWYGLRDDPRTFDWSPIGTANGLINVRPTPSNDHPRIAALSANQAVFALGKSDDSQWLLIQLPNNLQGWVQVRDINLAGDVSDLGFVED